MAVRVGIIGSHGLGQTLGVLGRGESHTLETPFGPHAGSIVTTELEGVSVVYVSRHGPGHLYNATRAPYRANLFALKMLGVTHVLATGTVSSLREHLQPLQLVLPDQVIDRTYRRPCTFYDDVAVHVELGHPFCSTLRQVLASAADPLGPTVHRDATYVCIEGPSLSTRAESLLYQSSGADVVGMTAMPEARLAREAELHYAMVALLADYDAWHTPPQDTAHEDRLMQASHHVQAATLSAAALIRRALPRIAEGRGNACRCDSALALAIATERTRIPDEVRTRLRPLLGRYLPPNVV
ncbi:MTAP family purine nucleoside phosphorylase [Pyxidicoccus parkwayensis]|uniref:Purine nucleoside phosphorylase n=1 Tax=Pyxidicoccus parkwayensis TaxID=2813578 RepID=A0ABX7NXJ4_9BACT|nr:MTAP family purine nucleoside phosphorylase [Pyxidicoccus parkwaysis]QSQ23594.1 MTAP family purine nucleoside phosphorylase [Pyxidicoccus parkwaysis]